MPPPEIEGYFQLPEFLSAVGSNGLVDEGLGFWIFLTHIAGGTSRQ